MTGFTGFTGFEQERRMPVLSQKITSHDSEDPSASMLSSIAETSLPRVANQSRETWQSRESR